MSERTGRIRRMNRKPGINSCCLLISGSTVRAVLNRSVLDPETRNGLVWFEPVPGTRVGEHAHGFHPLLRQAGNALPDIELLELRHFRPDGVTIWQACADFVRRSTIDEVGECSDETLGGYYCGVGRLEKTIVLSRFDRFSGMLDSDLGTTLTVVEYWLSGRRIAWTVTRPEA
jgi:hypothetical protein